MKVLILVQSLHIPPYDSFMKAQKETWDSVEVENVETVYYCAGGDNSWEGNVYNTRCNTDWNYQSWSHKLALDAVQDKEWDIVFRTNSSAYIDKRKLYDYCISLPTNRLYGGHCAEGQDWVSGAGIFYSRDVSDYIREISSDYPNPAEDVLLGTLLGRVGYVVTFRSNDRIDFITKDNFIAYNYKEKPSYHYRIKTDNREDDIKMMYELHNIIKR